MSKNIPLISVVVPVYNVEKYLTKCIDSLIKQSYQNIEIILVNDGSNDNSLCICQKYSEKDNRIVVIDKNNEGVAVARNTGIKKARGTWITFVDSDDWLEKNAIQLLVDGISQDSDIVMGSYYYNFPNSQLDMTYIIGNMNQIEYTVSKYDPIIFGACIINTSYFKNVFPKELRFGNLLHYPVLKIYRREVILKNIICFPAGIKQNEDKIFNYLYMKNARSIVYIPKPIYHYRIRTGMASASSGIVLARQYLDAVYKWKHITSSETKYDHEQILLFLDLNNILLTKALSSALVRDMHNIKEWRESSIILKDFSKNKLINKSITKSRCSYLPKYSTRLSMWLIRNRMFSIELLLSKIVKGVKNEKH